MIKIRIEGVSYYYEPKTSFLYLKKIYGGGVYYTPLNYCDVRIKDFIKTEAHTIYTHPEENAGKLNGISQLLDKMLSLFKK